MNSKSIIGLAVGCLAMLSATTAALGARTGQLTILSASMDTSGTKLVISGLNMDTASAVTLGGSSPLTMLSRARDRVEVRLPEGTLPGSYLLMVSGGEDATANDDMWFTVSTSCATGSQAAASPSTYTPRASAADTAAASPGDFSSLRVGADNFIAYADGGSISFGPPNGTTTGYSIGVGRTPWTDSGGTYIDSTFGLGLFPKVTGEPTIGLTMESKYRQSATSPFASEFIQNWKSPDGRFSRRPHQWNAQHDTGLVQHSMQGRVEYFSSAGQQQIIINERGALQFVAGDKQIYMGGATIIASGTDDVSINFAALNNGSFAFRNSSSNLFQLTAIPAGNSINGYLQIRPSYFSGYQREIGMNAAGTATDIPVYLSAKGAGDVAFRTGGSTIQVDVQHTPSANRYLTLTGSSGGDPKISTNSGNVSFGRPVSTPDPTSGQGPAWQLGAVKAGALVADTENFVEVRIGADVVKLLKAR